MILLGVAHAQDYAFPTSAEDYGEFYPTAYVDHGGVTDWNCGDITYEGHHGSDFGGGSWSGMEAGRDITAAAPGTVVATNDGADDECSTGDCDGGGGFGNYVKIQHADGKYTYYAHMKTWSVLVSVGQCVVCGQKLGEMGSSGHSTGPHVHFEVRDSGGSYTDPFDGACSAPPMYWVDQGAWGALPALVCDDVAPCTSIGALQCGESVGTSNDAAGYTTSHAAYGCDEFSYSGPEVAYTFATTLDEAVTVSLSGNGADVDLFVLSSDACDGGGSLGCSTNPDAEGESVSFTATAGASYTVVVDGFEGATTGFTLSAACAGGWPGEDTSPPEETGQSDSGIVSEETGVTPEEPVEPLEPSWVRLDALGCGKSGAAVWLVGISAGLRRRRSVKHL